MKFWQVLTSNLLDAQSKTALPGIEKLKTLFYKHLWKFIVHDNDSARFIALMKLMDAIGISQYTGVSLA